MDLVSFTKLFAESIDDIDIESVVPETEFKNLKEWDSLANLNILAMIDAEFNRTISSDELLKCNTVHDLFDFLIEEK